MSRRRPTRLCSLLRCERRLFTTAFAQSHAECATSLVRGLLDLCGIPRAPTLAHGSRWIGGASCRPRIQRSVVSPRRVALRSFRHARRHARDPKCKMLTEKLGYYVVSKITRLGLLIRSWATKIGLTDNRVRAASQGGGRAGLTINA